MSKKNLLKQTIIYGLATVLPRMISFLLNPLYVDTLHSKAEFGDVSIIFSYLVFLNVVLSYGMETAFFRFYNTESEPKKVINTATISLMVSTLFFLVIAYFFINPVAHFIGVKPVYIQFTVWILVFDALCIIPFTRLRAEKKPMKYAFLKTSNVLINITLNLFFLIGLPWLVLHFPDSFWASIYDKNFQIGYIFLSNLAASLVSLLLLLPAYNTIKWQLDKIVLKKMLRYGLPVLLAGIGFAINEHFDKILLNIFLVSKSEIGAYSACYKIGMFMVLFRTAYTLGIEPFFFSYADNADAPQMYADITKYFVIFGSFISLFVIAFIDLIKIVIVPSSNYWTAIKVVPLIVLANFFLGIYTNLSVWYKLTNKTMIGAYISMIGAAVTLLLNFLLIPTMSYYGSAIATIAAYGSMMLISYLWGRKQYPIPYDSNRIFGYLVLSILLSGISFYIDILRYNYFIKCLFLLVFMYFIYHNEKDILMRIIKKKR